jgi:hypothetical protein
MLFFPMTGNGSGLFLFFLLPILLPMIMRVLAGLSGGMAAPSQSAMMGRPASISRPVATAESFAAAKAEFPGQMIELDNEITLADEFGNNLDADEMQTARSHMNQAFATYSKYFGGDNNAGVDVVGGRREVGQHLRLAKRHLLLADPLTADSVQPEAPAPAPTATADVNDAADARYFATGVEQGSFANVPLNPFAQMFAAPQVASHNRQTSVRLTPFGLMISSF